MAHHLFEICIVRWKKGVLLGFGRMKQEPENLEVISKLHEGQHIGD